jgi:hypothetical protein
MITSQEQLVSKSDYDYEDFLRLLVSAADQLGVLVVSGFWARRKNILCVFCYVDGLNRLWYFDYIAQRKRYVDVYGIEAFGVLCDVPPLDEIDQIEGLGPINSPN